MFTPSNLLMNYLNAQPRDIFDIVGALMGYINVDPMFKTNDFEQAVQYVLSHGVTREELFDQFDSEVDFEENPDNWNEEYYSYARVYLKDNFCEKRIAHVKAVAKKIYSSSVGTASERPVAQNADYAGNLQKKVQSQQMTTNKKPMPVWIKVGIAIVVIALLAQVIKAILR